jgi:SOS-response transcriptional repressor LexA
MLVSNYINLDTTTKLLVRVNSDKFSCFFINIGDILVVDTVAKISDGMRILVSLNGKLNIRIFRTIADKNYIQTPENNFLPLSINPNFEYKVIGVITTISTVNYK